MANAFVEQAPASNDGGWPTTPENAYTNNNAYAIATTTDDTCIYFNFDFDTIADPAVIVGIRVKINGDWHDPGATDVTAPKIAVALTWNGGGTPTWTTEKNTQFLEEDAEQEFYLGGASDNWGHAWTLAEIKDTANFRVRVKSKSTGVTGAPEWRIDYIQVAVYYLESSGAFDTAPFTYSVTSSIIPVSVREVLSVADSGSGGALGYSPQTNMVQKGGTAVSQYQNSTTSEWDLAAVYNRVEACVVQLSLSAVDNIKMFIGDHVICTYPADPSPIVQQAQPGLIGIDSITYSSNFGTPQVPAQASIKLVNKLYGNALTATTSKIPEWMVNKAFLGSELVIYAMVRRSAKSVPDTPWRSRVIFRGAVTDVSVTDIEVTVNATQSGHGDIPVPDQQITDNTFFYEENLYSAVAGKEGNKIEEKMGAVIPIGIGRFDIYAVESTWASGHILGSGVSADEKTALGIIPAMMGVKYPMMPCVAAVRNWTGKHSEISITASKVSGRRCEIYQQVYLHGSRKGTSALVVSHGWTDTQGDYILGTNNVVTTTQAARLMPIYTWNRSGEFDIGMPFVRDDSERSRLDPYIPYDQLGQWSSAGSMDVPKPPFSPRRQWTDGDASQAAGVFVNIGLTSDGADINMLTHRPHFSGSLQAFAVPFESLGKLEGWCRLESYFHLIEGDDILNSHDLLRQDLAAPVSLIYDDSEAKKGWGVYQAPPSAPSAGTIWGLRVGGIWNPTASNGRLEMIGRYAGPYDPYPNHTNPDHRLYWSGWPMQRILSNYIISSQRMHPSVNTEFFQATPSLDLWPGHYLKIPDASTRRYFAWWILSPWRDGFGGPQYGDGPQPMVAENRDPHSGKRGMASEWEFQSWGWNSADNAFLHKYPWEVRFACGQKTPAVDNTLVLDKAWIEVIFKAKVNQDFEAPLFQPGRYYQYAPNRVDPSRFAYLWRKGGYSTQQNDNTNSSDIFISGVGPTTGGSVIEKGPEVSKLLISHYSGGNNVAGSTNFGSFDTALTMSAGMPMSVVVDRQGTLATVLGEIARQTYSIIEEQLDDNGELQWRAFVDTPDPATDAPARIYRSDISFKFIPTDIFTEPNFIAYTSRLDDLTSDIRVKYGWHIPSGTWSGEIFLNKDGSNLTTEAATYVAAANSTYKDYGQLENPQVHEFHDIWNKAAAEKALKWLFNKQRRRSVFVDFVTYVRHTDLRIGHVIRFDDTIDTLVKYPGELGSTVWSAHNFTVLGISYSKDVDGFLRIQILGQEVYTSA